MPRSPRVLIFTIAAVPSLSIGTAAFAAANGSTAAVGPDASGPARFGLCTAYAASTGAHPQNLDAIAFVNLAAAAAASPGQTVEAFCAASPTDPDGTPGSTTTTTAPPDTDF